MAAGYEGNCSWGALAFLTSEPQLGHALADRRLRKTVRQSPSGGRIAVQVRGQEPGELSVRATLQTVAIYNAFLGQVGQLATLTLAGDSARPNVMLTDVTDGETDDLNDLAECTLTFLGV